MANERVGQVWDNNFEVDERDSIIPRRQRGAPRAQQPTVRNDAIYNYYDGDILEKVDLQLHGSVRTLIFQDLPEYLKKHILNVKVRIQECRESFHSVCTSMLMLKY